MQRQADREQKTQGTTPGARVRRGKRSWGELLAGWLLLLWGITATLTCVFFIVPNWQLDSLLDKGGGICVVLYGPLCLLGALCSLLRHRTAARWLLTSAGICMGGMSVLEALWEWNRGNHDLYHQSLSAGLFALSALLLFLGRWIGRQEDAEG